MDNTRKCVDACTLLKLAIITSAKDENDINEYLDSADNEGNHSSYLDIIKKIERNEQINKIKTKTKLENLIGFTESDLIPRKTNLTNTLTSNILSQRPKMEDDTDVVYESESSDVED